MKIVRTIAEMREARRKLNGSVGFVPTMGYLHEGHLELARRARAENKNAVASIFVNPTQFGPSDDFAAYPRDPERDLQLLKQEKVNVVFMPSAEEMYPPGCSTWVEVEEVSEGVEGSSRPGHFRGVATVVAKLFNIVEPAKAYFGEKDAQQLVVIKKMVADLNMNLQVVAVPTVREVDGLAMSSRNVYLDPDERESALVLYKALKTAQKLRQKEPSAEIEYVSVAHPETLEELERIDGPALLSLAVKVGKTRLIDAMTV